MQYYFHENARRTFRSTVEVAKFMLYEAYPEKPVKAESKGGLKKDCLVSYIYIYRYIKYMLPVWITRITGHETLLLP